MTLHEVIKSYRLASNLTQEEMADKMRMTEQTYLRWENGKTKMTDEKLQLFAKAIGKSTDEIRAAVQDGNSINLLQQDNEYHDGGTVSNLTINYYYGNKELSQEIEYLKNLLAEKDKIISMQAQQLETLQTLLKSSVK